MDMQNGGPVYKSNCRNNFSKQLPAADWMLTPERERDLIRAAQSSDLAAAERAKRELITAHMPKIKRHATAFRSRALSYQDKIQHGVLGLLTALTRFDSTRGARLATFADPYIMFEILHAVEDAKLPALIIVVLNILNLFYIWKGCPHLRAAAFQSRIMRRLFASCACLNVALHGRGKDSVDHGPAGSDDFANVLFGALWLCRTRPEMVLTNLMPIHVRVPDATAPHLWSGFYSSPSGGGFPW